MSDDPNTRQAAIERAAEVLYGSTALDNYGVCPSIHYYIDLAEMLADAGLLADPTTPTLAAEQTEMNEAVRALLNMVPERAGSGETTRLPWDRVKRLRAALWRYDEAFGREARRAAITRPETDQ